MSTRPFNQSMYVMTCRKYQFSKTVLSKSYTIAKKKKQYSVKQNQNLTLTSDLDPIFLLLDQGTKFKRP